MTKNWQNAARKEKKSGNWKVGVKFYFVIVAGAMKQQDESKKTAKEEELKTFI